MFCANKPKCGPEVAGSRGTAEGVVEEGRRAGEGVQVLTSQVQVDNESPCLLCENDLRDESIQDRTTSPILISSETGSFLGVGL